MFLLLVGMLLKLSIVVHIHTGMNRPLIISEQYQDFSQRLLQPRNYPSKQQPCVCALFI